MKAVKKANGMKRESKKEKEFRELFTCSKCGVNLLKFGVTEVLVQPIVQTFIEFTPDSPEGNVNKNCEPEIEDWDDEWVRCGACGEELHDRTASEMVDALKQRQNLLTEKSPQKEIGSVSKTMQGGQRHERDEIVLVISQHGEPRSVITANYRETQRIQKLLDEHVASTGGDFDEGTFIALLNEHGICSIVKQFEELSSTGGK